MTFSNLSVLPSPASRPFLLFLPSTLSPDSSMAQSFSSSGLCSNVSNLKCHSINPWFISLIALSMICNSLAYLLIYCLSSWLACTPHQEAMLFSAECGVSVLVTGTYHHRQPKSIWRMLVKWITGEEAKPKERRRGHREEMEQPKLFRKDFPKFHHTSFLMCK